jgi:hypothetical protein
MRRRYDFSLGRPDNIRFFLVTVPIAVTRRVFSGGAAISRYVVGSIIFIEPVFIVIGHRASLNWLVGL